MTDIADELRKIERAGDIPPKGHPSLAGRAADEIERLRKALTEIANQKTTIEIAEEYGEESVGDYETGYDAIIEIARAAVSSTDGGGAT